MTDQYADDLAPVVTALEDAFGAGTVLPGLVPGLRVTDTSGWLSAAQLTGGGIDVLLDAAVRRWDAPPHVAAALMWKAYSYWLALPAVFGLVVARRVPHLAATEVLVRLDAPRAPVVLGLRPGTAVSRAPGMLAALRRTLLDEHAGPMIEEIRGRVRLSERALLGSLAAGVVNTAQQATRVAGIGAAPVVAELLSELDLTTLIDVTEAGGGRVRVRRRTCCLAFMLPQPKICHDCCFSHR